MIVSVRFAPKSTPIELLQYRQPAHLSWIRTTQERNANRKNDFFDSIGQTRSSERFRYTSAQAPKAELQATQRNVAVVPICMARPCVARRSFKTDERESCNNVLGL